MSLQFRREGGIAVVALAHPPVNALSHAVRVALVETFTSLSDDAAIEAVVLHGAGNGFCAGGDRTEFGTPAAIERPTLSRDVLAAIEACAKPVVAAMHGYALGGGLELALACDARVAVAGTRMGLPEVPIGLFPLSGSQRLPRLIGIETAAELMLAGKSFVPEEPFAAPLFERTVSAADELVPAALQVARATAAIRPIRVRDRPFPDPDPHFALRRVLQRHPQSSCTAAQWAVLQALSAAVESSDFETGLERAQVLFDALGGNRRPLQTARPGMPS
jgi:3-hydroxyacyl-CoA dehydrogenase